MSWVYILKSEEKDKYYIGSAADPEKRLLEHNSGRNKFTRPFRPWKIVFKQEYCSLKCARGVEIRLKRYKSRKIIEQIIKDGHILGH